MEGDIGQRVQELVRAGKQLEALEMLETTLQQAEATEQTPGLSADLCELCNIASGHVLPQQRRHDHQPRPAETS